MKERDEDAKLAEMWANAIKAEKDDPKFFNLKDYGIKVVKILEVGEKFTPPNKYANKININKVKQTYSTKQATTPSYRYLVVEFKHWTNSEEYEGRKATVLVSERLWHAIINTTLRMKTIGVKQPEYIIFYFKHTFIQWFCFVTDKKFQEILPVLNRFDKKDKEYIKELDNLCYWDGNNRLGAYLKPGNKEKFAEFYKDQYK